MVGYAAVTMTGAYEGVVVVARRAASTALVCAALACAAVLAGCTGPGPAATGGSASGASATTGAGSASSPPGSTSSQGTATSGGKAASGGKATSTPTTKGSPRPTSRDARKGLPQVTPTTVGAVSYGPATAADRAAFASVQKASGGLLVSSAVSHLTVGGRDAGAVAVYGTKRGMAKSEIFQDQYVVQLINAVTKEKASPRFVKVQDQVFALSTGRVAVAGWFEGDQVVLVYRRGSAPQLLSLAAAVRATPS